MKSHEETTVSQNITKDRLGNYKSSRLQDLNCLYFFPPNRIKIEICLVTARYKKLNR